MLSANFVHAQPEASVLIHDLMIGWLHFFAHGRLYALIGMPSEVLLSSPLFFSSFLPSKGSLSTGLKRQRYFPKQQIRSSFWDQVNIFLHTCPLSKIYWLDTAKVMQIKLLQLKLAYCGHKKHHLAIIYLKLSCYIPFTNYCSWARWPLNCLP